MFNEAQVSLTGYVATQPRFRTTSNGIPSLSMRVAWTPRWKDAMTGEWSDGNTSYVTVTCWRKLADNVALCLRKGDPVVVKGRLSIRSYTDKEGVSRTQVDVDANSVGHDLSRGVALFQRTRPATGKTADEHAAELTAGGHDDSSDPGSADLRQDALAAVGVGMPPADSGPGDSDMFDEDAISELAGQADSVAVPF